MIIPPTSEKEEGEGILSGVYIEPTSDDAPSGWGPPKTEEFPVGTPGELPIATVINNNPDSPAIYRNIKYGGDDYEGTTPAQYTRLAYTRRIRIFNLESYRSKSYIFRICSESVP